MSSSSMAMRPPAWGESQKGTDHKAQSYNIKNPGTPTFGIPTLCCPMDTPAVFWASERYSGSEKHAGRKDTFY